MPIVQEKDLPRESVEASLLSAAGAGSEKIIFFDLDHTLFLNPFWSSVFPEIARSVSKDKGVAPQEVTMAIMGYSRALFRTRSVHSYDWDMVVQNVLSERFNYNWQKPLVEMVKEGLASSQLLDGAKEALAQVRDQGWLTIAASQGFRCYQEPVIEHLGLKDYFSRTRFSDDFNCLKRNRAFYGVLPEGSRVVVVGDRYIDDCLYPENFAFASVWYTGLYRDKKAKTHLLPRAEINSLHQLPTVLEDIKGGIQPLQQGVNPLCLSCLGARAEADGRCRLCQEVDLLGA